WFSPDSRELAVFGGHTLAVFDLESGKRLWSKGDKDNWYLPDPERTGVVFNSSSSLLAVHGPDRSVLLDAATGKVRYALPEWAGDALQSRNGRYFVAVGTDDSPSGIQKFLQEWFPSKWFAGRRMYAELVDLESGAIHPDVLWGTVFAFAVVGNDGKIL